MKIIASILKLYPYTWWREWRFPLVITLLCALTITAYTKAPTDTAYTGKPPAVQNATTDPKTGASERYRDAYQFLMPLAGAGVLMWGVYAFTGCPYQRRTEGIRFAYFFMLASFCVLALPPLLKNQAISSEPIGIVSGCVADDTGVEQLRCKKPGDPAGQPPANNQWLVNIGGTTHSQTAVAGCDEETSPECKIGSRKNRAEITGGLVVPLPFIIIALFGGAVSMSRRIPELQKRSEDNYTGTDAEPKLQPAEVREMLAFQLLQFLSAPLIAVVAYEALRPDSGSTSAALAFMSGFGSETILMMVRGVVDGIKPKVAAPPAAAGAATPVPAAATGAPPVPLRLAVGTTGLDAGRLRLTVDNTDTPIGPDGLIELRLAPDKPHRIVASARRAGAPVTNQLDLTPSPDDRDKPLSISL
jgi:hypothetical protein